MDRSLAMTRYWAEIDLDRLTHNLHTVQAISGGRGVLAVLKSDAYGHGAVQCAKALEKAGAAYLAVAMPEEALLLRKHGITMPVMLLGMADTAWMPLLCQNDITAVIGSLDSAFACSRLLQSKGMSKKLKVHFCVNTGMNRIGLEHETAADDIEEIIRQCPSLLPEGIWTHFADAARSGPSLDFTKEQYSRFMRAVGTLKDRGITFPYVHCANSDALAWCRDAILDGTNLVRAGCILYGAADYSRDGVDLLPVMSLKGKILHVHSVRAGEPVSYGCTWRASRPSVIATVGSGYADGWPRSLSNRMTVLVNGSRVPQAGRMAMDQMMIDVTEAGDVRPGDTVTFVGTDGDDTLFMREHAALIPTGTSELLPKVSKRVPRIYFENSAFTEAVSGIHFE